VAARGRGRGGPAAAAPSARAPGSRVHEGLVGERALVGTAYLADPRLRAEYAAEIAPRTVVALGKVLRELEAAAYVPPGAEGAWRRPGARLLDLGAGTGAVGQALRAHLGGGGAHVNLLAVDRIAGAVPGVIAADVTDVARLAELGGPFALVVAAHVLNELWVALPEAERLERLGRLVARWCEDLLDEGGALVLLEPALRETSRALLGVRDRLVAAGLRVVAPCFFAGPCPALARERDWCHDAAVAPANGRRIDFSYLVVRAPGAGPTAAADATAVRVVSDPRPEKGRLRIYGCGADGRHAFIRLDRHASEANAALDRAKRGDVLHIARTSFAQDGLRIGADTEVRKRERP